MYSKTLANFTRTINLIERVFQIPWGQAPGLRSFDQWTVAEGEPAAIRAIHDYHDNGGPAPPEITMVAHVVALYGGQIALSREEIVLLMPEGIPRRMVAMAQAAGYATESDPEKPYQALVWNASLPPE